MDSAKFVEFFKLALQDKSTSTALQKAIEPMLDRKFRQMAEKLERQEQYIADLEERVEELKKSMGADGEIDKSKSRVQKGKQKRPTPKKKPRRREERLEKVPDLEVEGVPAPDEPHKRESITVPLEMCAMVVFDLETTSLERTADITQIAAVCDDKQFVQYMMPTKPITKKASEVTQITVDDDKMCHKGVQVAAVDAKTGLRGFVDFLKSLPHKPSLLGHNIRRFDAPVLINALEQEGLYADFEPTIAGFIDTLPLMKTVKPGLERYNQEFLVRQILDKEYETHNSLSDVTTLQELLAEVDAPAEKKLAYSFTCAYMKAAMAISNVKKQNMRTLDGLVSQNVVSRFMAGRIGAAGLTLDHLQLAFSKHGSEGIEAVLALELPSGRPRVTRDVRVIKSIINHFDQAKENA